jgi:dethiobiotin synthetase
VFVVGTDTGVGKTVVAGAICATLADRGERVAAFKPVVTGLDDPPEDGWPRDHELRAAAASAGQEPGDVTPYTFGPPLSPHYAAELAGSRIETERIVEAFAAAVLETDAVVCEGVGGLLVPLNPSCSVLDVATLVGLPVVVVARSGLGTINHPLLTVEMARAAGLAVVGIVMTPWADPEPIEESNRSTVELLTGVAVSALPPTSPDTLAAAGRALPIDSWL